MPLGGYRDETMGTDLEAHGGQIRDSRNRPNLLRIRFTINYGSDTSDPEKASIKDGTRFRRHGSRVQVGPPGEPGPQVTAD